MRVRFRIDHPNQTQVDQLVNAANAVATKSDRYTYGGATAGYTVNNCAAAEAQARQAAMSDAQNRAEAIAKTAGTQVGRISSLSETVTWGNNYSTTCPASGDPTAFDAYSSPYYPSSAPVVKLIYSLNVSYDMR
jgi:hypothetical protein